VGLPGDPPLRATVRCIPDRSGRWARGREREDDPLLRAARSPPQPVRSGGGYRLYGADDEERLSFIAQPGEPGSHSARSRWCSLFATADKHRATTWGRPSDVASEKSTASLTELRQLKRELAKLDAVARSLPERPETPAAFCHILEASAGSRR
jgi:hypothetical protein